jgi:hypothetical protein
MLYSVESGGFMGQTDTGSAYQTFVEYRGVFGQDFYLKYLEVDAILMRSLNASRKSNHYTFPGTEGLEVSIVPQKSDEGDVNMAIRGSKPDCDNLANIILGFNLPNKKISGEALTCR